MHAEKFFMTIRGIAKELYHLQQEVEALERKLEDSPLEKRTDVEFLLRKAVAERNRLRRILDGQLDR